MRAAGLQDGVYDLGGLKVIVKNSEAHLESGTLSGSTLAMIKAIKNMIEKIGINIKESVRMASLNPAQLLGLDKDRGFLAPGKRADIAILDDDLMYSIQLREGRLIYNRNYAD